MSAKTPANTETALWGLIPIASLGALGRRFESCRPDSVIPTALGIPGGLFFWPNWPMYEKCTNGLAYWTHVWLRLDLVREMYESPLPAKVRVLPGGL